jgi:hypothetical protein
VVNFDDYSRAPDFGINPADTGWSNGDFDGSGSVNLDYALIDLPFNI